MIEFLRLIIAMAGLILFGGSMSSFGAGFTWWAVIGAVVGMFIAYAAMGGLEQ